MQNLHQLFVLCTASQMIGGDFAKFSEYMHFTTSICEFSGWNRTEQWPSFTYHLYLQHRKSLWNWTKTMQKFIILSLEMVEVGLCFELFFGPLHFWIMYYLIHFKFFNMDQARELHTYFEIFTIGDADCLVMKMAMGKLPKEITIVKRSIFQTFWKVHCCAKSFFLS